MGEQERCPECGRQFATTAHEQAYPEWCNGSMGYGCLRAQLALARKALAAAEEMRSYQKLSPPRDTLDEALSEAFDAAMAEVRKGKG